MALSFAMVGLFFSVQEKAEQPLGYSYKVELVSLVDEQNFDPAQLQEQRFQALQMTRKSIIAMNYIPPQLKNSILVGLDEEIFDVKAAMERAKSARMGKGKATKRGANKECAKCLPEKEAKTPEVKRFLEGQSWV